MILHLFLVLTGNPEQTGTKEVVGRAKFTSRAISAEGEKREAKPGSVSVGNSVFVVKIHLCVFILREQCYRSVTIFSISFLLQITPTHL